MDLLNEIDNLTEKNIHEVVDKVLNKYRQLFPDWEIATFAICLKDDRNAQIDTMIRLLKSIKTSQ